MLQKKKIQSQNPKYNKSEKSLLFLSAVFVESVNLKKEREVRLSMKGSGSLFRA